MSSTKAQAQGHWIAILQRLGVDAALLDGKHRACPSCGGSDRFRFDDVDGSGSHICSQCGAGDGFALVQKMMNLADFKETAALIDDVMGWKGEHLTSEQQQAHKEKAALLKAEREEAEHVKQTKAAADCVRLWSTAKDAKADHAYLVAKHIGAYGIKQQGATLIIPARIEGVISSVQYIKPNGGKWFYKGGRVDGGYHSITGDTAATTSRIVIVEGYGTGASVRAFTGCHVAVAFNASNLGKVAKAIRAKLPQAQIIIAADNDRKKERNTGYEEATAAALAVNGVVALVEGKEGVSVDWNDYHQQHGNAKTKVAFFGAVSQSRYGLPKKENDTTPETKQAQSSALKPNPQDKSRVNLLCASDMKMTPVDWVWKGWLACGKMHIFAGVAGTGKTTIALNFAATITTGGKWADGTKAKKGSVFVWSGEDDPHDSLLPRLAASGADMSKVHFVGDTMDEKGLRSFDPAKDMQLLLQATARLDDLRLIIVDPIVSAIAGDSHKNAEVRRSLQPLVDVAAKAGAAVLGITHFNKSTVGKDPTDRVTGSLAFAALARVVMCTAKPLDGEDKRRFIRTKSNIGSDGGGFEYDLKRVEVQQGIEGQYIEWGESLEGTAHELLNDIESEKDDENSALAAVKAWILDALKDEPLPAARLRKLGEDHGYSWATIRRAKLALKIESKKVGFGKQSATLWHYPKQGEKPPSTILAQAPLSHYANGKVEPLCRNECDNQKTGVSSDGFLQSGSNMECEPLWSKTPQKDIFEGKKLDPQNGVIEL